MQFSKDQSNLIAELNQFLRDPARKEFTIFGLAGTGKTTVATHLAGGMDNAFLCAFTNRAASILSAKAGVSACTLHSILYAEPTKTLDEDGRVQLHFDARNHRPDALCGYVIFVDECSMLDVRLVQDLRRTGAKIVFLGDPGQLPPVGGDSAITRADFTLTEIHRQAAGEMYGGFSLRDESPEGFGVVLPNGDALQAGMTVHQAQGVRYETGLV
jgi:exodeoxyribonuclease V